MLKQIQEAISLLHAGKTVVIPTETVYGLAADATNTQAVERLLEMKGRENTKSPPLIAADIQMVEMHCEFSPAMRDLANQFWPGPLTLVLPVIEGSTLCPAAVRDGTVAIRVSSHPTARVLSKELGSPIVATSANLAGEKMCYDTASVHTQFDSRLLQPDFYLDEGLIEYHEASTIVTEQEGKLVVLRQGDIEIL